MEGQDGYSTTGKWAEGKFWIAGGEEVYEGIERDEDGDTDDEQDDDGWDKIAQDHQDDDGDVPVLDGEEVWAQEAVDSEAELWEGIPLSPWHDSSHDPVREGEYDVITGTWPFPQRAHWTGRVWRDLNGQKIDVAQWRGLSAPV